MKKVLFGLFALVLLGAGCMPTAKVQGDWYLAFDLPQDWVMVRQYNPTSELAPVAEGITRDLSDIVLQSTPANVYVSPGYLPNEEDLGEGVTRDDLKTDDFTSIRVLKLDARRVVPSEAEDLGGGFYREQLCEDGGECQIGGKSNYQYYFVSEAGEKYQFIIVQQGQELKVAEEVILSAKPVMLE